MYGQRISKLHYLSLFTSILASAAIAVGYTLFGGLYSVAYTDVVQLFCIFVGLWFAVPFAMTHDAVGQLTGKDGIDWFGKIELDKLPQVADVGFLFIFGGIPWQCYFQRVLSSKTSRGSQLLSYYAAFGCLLMALPAAFLGGIAKAADWNITDYGRKHMMNPLEQGDALMILPLVIHYLTPGAVGIFGLGAVTAAVMSSADSSVLSASSMFARNIYRSIIRNEASATEIMWVLKFAVLVVGAIASSLSLTVTSVYSLSVVSSDLVYVILFPQLFLVVYFKKHVNTYGSALAFIVGLCLRLASGEQLINIPPLIKFPGFENGVQQFPFRTFCMLSSMATMLVVSKLSPFILRVKDKQTN